MFEYLKFAFNCGPQVTTEPFSIWRRRLYYRHGVIENCTLLVVAR
jgi:hypothetical protein